MLCVIIKRTIVNFLLFCLNDHNTYLFHFCIHSVTLLAAVPTAHSQCPFFNIFVQNLSKCVFWILKKKIAVFYSLYYKLSYGNRHKMLVLSIWVQGMQDHRPFCSFAWNFRFLLITKVSKQAKFFTGAHLGTQTQLIMNKLSPTDMLIIKNQVQLGALKV